MGLQPAEEPIQAYYKLVFPHSEYYLQTLSVTIGRRPATRTPPSSKAERVDEPHSGSVKPEQPEGAGPPAGSEAGSSPEKEAGSFPANRQASPTPDNEASSSSSHPPVEPQRRPLSSLSSNNVVDVDLGPLKSVSRLHARIDYDEHIGKFILSVLGRNGAWVDGDWVGCGGRVALGADTKIQIATRTFYFVLPPPPPQPTLTPDTTPDAIVPAPDDALNTPSPCHSRSPSRSISPSREKPPPKPGLKGSKGQKKRVAPTKPVSIADSEDDRLVSIDDLQPEDLPQLDAVEPSSAESVQINGPRSKARLLPSKAVSSRPLLAPKADLSSSVAQKAKLPKPIKPVKSTQTKAPDPPPQRPPPDQMPPKPPYTYALLCYRAIHAHGGQASLSEIVSWIREEFEWYRWNDECGWESSVRHNLSSNPAFIKDRRENLPQISDTINGKPRKTKGFFWSVDPKSEETFLEKEREIKEMGTRVKALAKGKGKEKEEHSPKSIPVPGMVVPQPAYAHPMAGRPLTFIPRAFPPQATIGASSSSISLPLTVPQLGPPPPLPSASTLPTPAPPSSRPPALPHLANRPLTSTPPTGILGSGPAQTPTLSSQPSSMSDVCLPIVVGPPPNSMPAQSASSTPVTSIPFTDGPPITLHSGTLFLNPTIFSGLTSEQLSELQTLKAAKALEILQGYIKSFLKEQMMRKQGRGKAKSRVNKAGESEGKTSSVTLQPSGDKALPVLEQPVATSPSTSPGFVPATSSQPSSVAPIPLTAPSSSSTISHPIHPVIPHPQFAYYPHLASFPQLASYPGGWAYPGHLPQFAPYSAVPMSTSQFAFAHAVPPSSQVPLSIGVDPSKEPPLKKQRVEESSR